MPKTKISEFSATPANNTDIDSINIAEGCAPSGINDAIRELMAQLKDFQTGAVGDSFNGPVGTSTAAAGAFTTLSASSTATLSGLTASTALALDASKNIVSVTNTGTGSNVLATSPTLVTPALGTPSAAVLTNATGLPISTGVSGLGTGVATLLATPSSANLASAITDETGSGSLVFATSPTLVTPILGTPTSATLTNATGLPISTGVSGLGTGIATALAVNTGSSGAPVINGGVLGTPSSGTVTNLTGTASININGTVGATTASTGAFTTLSATGVTTVQAGSAASPAITTTGDTNTGIFFPAADTICFSEGGLEAMRIDSAGNVGVGTTPSAWFSTYRALVLGYANNGMFSGGDVQLGLTQNAFLDSGVSWRYTTSNPASQYIQINSAHQWFTAPSGTAGNAISFTQAMTLDASGNLGIGTSSPSRKLTIEASGAAFPSTSNPSVRLNETSSGRFAVMELDSSQNLNFWNGDTGSGLTRFYRGSGSGTLSMAIDGAGNTTFAGNISVGGATVTTSGTGITFPATQSPSSDANTLDDYEEGTYGSSSANGILTPSTSGSITCASTFSCTYTKIGRQVTCQGQIVVSSVSSPVGFIQIALPFTQLSATNAIGCGTFISYNIDLPTGAVSNGMTSQTGNVTFCWPRVSVDNAPYANVDSALLIAGSEIQFIFSFITS